MHGGLVLVSSRGFQVGADLVGPLAIEDKSQVWGLYYPPPAGAADPSYAGVAYPHDFMVTPIRPDSWSYCARLRARIRHRPGRLVLFTRYLAAKRVTFVSGEQNRSGHRYSTVQAVVDFEGIREEFVQAHGRTDVVSPAELRANIDRIIAELRDELGAHDVLFAVDDIPELADPIEVQPIGALGYFDRIRRARQQSNEGGALMFEAFYKGGMLECDDSFRKILEEQQLEPLPTYCFAEMDTQDMNLRFVVIPRAQLERFASLQIDYRSGRESTRGLLSAVSSAVADTHNIWRVGSRVRGTTRVEGTLTLFIEDQSGGRQARIESERDRIEIQVTREAPAGVSIRSVKLRPLRPYRVFISLKEGLPSHEDLVNECRSVAEDYGIHVQVVHTNTTSATSEVKERLKSSHGVVQFYFGAKPDEQFTWLEAECFGADVLDIPCIRVVDPQFKERLRIARDNPLIEMSLSDSKEQKTAVLRRVFQQLSEKMAECCPLDVRARR